jgi:hypothetical protein
MSSANSNKSNGGPNRDGHGGGWGHRKGSSQSQIGGGGGDQTAWRTTATRATVAQIDEGHGGWGCRKGSSQGQNGGCVVQTSWRALDKPYREWLVSRGLAVDAAAFNALSFEQKLKAAEIAAVARTAEHSELFWYNRDRGRGG